MQYDNHCSAVGNTTGGLRERTGAYDDIVDRKNNSADVPDGPQLDLFGGVQPIK